MVEHNIVWLEQIAFGKKSANGFWCCIAHNPGVDHLNGREASCAEFFLYPVRPIFPPGVSNIEDRRAAIHHDAGDSSRFLGIEVRSPIAFVVEFPLAPFFIAPWMDNGPRCLRENVSGEERRLVLNGLFA